MEKPLLNDKPITEKSLARIENKTNEADAQGNFPEEITHLEEIKVKLNDALKSFNETVKRYDQEYMDSKRYLANFRHEIDPKEIFQNEMAMKQIESVGIHAVQRRDRIAKLVDSPYFARIDFHKEGDRDASIFYIGRFSFSDTSQMKILIFDWRTPISSMFYDCELGRAGYDAPLGKVHGELTRKRQFKISQGQMEYVLESAINIQDDVLQRELSRASDEKMKTIIATIQREQNRIIRNEQTETLIIQGVAGSGKTSIALHRIAYLLYRYKETLSAHNVAILSPNKVFADYISNVLPELGEEPIYEMSFADIAGIQLDGIIQFEPDRDPLETDDPAWAERVRFKSEIAFVAMMDQYLEYATLAYFKPIDYEFGRFKATKEWILTRYNAYRNYPVKRRLYQVAEDIHDRFHTENLRGEELPKQKAIYQKLAAMFKIQNTLALYQDFYRTMKIPEKFVMSGKKRMEWADVYPFMYFHAALEGLKKNQLIRHLVIDEMQDYTPVQYVVINKLFNCKKTILGDFGQSLNPNHLHSLDDFRSVYKNAEIVELNKSYRSTYEIITFAKRIQNVAVLEPAPRHGDTPEIIFCSDAQDELVKTRGKIKAFEVSGHATLGIILKTNNKANAVYQLLSKDYDLQLLTPDSRQFTKGITVTSIQMSKGLEFDEVIILGANRETYYTDYDRKLLYIACTRAMHRLALLHTGELTGLIKEE
jgi:DNA helicase-2/ATP-dependent DNA helicase PcrA